MILLLLLVCLNDGAKVWGEKGVCKGIKRMGWGVGGFYFCRGTRNGCFTARGAPVTGGLLRGEGGERGILGGAQAITCARGKKGKRTPVTGILLRRTEPAGEEEKERMTECPQERSLWAGEGGGKRKVEGLICHRRCLWGAPVPGAGEGEEEERKRGRREGASA
jgi:hypothetical protein